MYYENPDGVTVHSGFPNAAADASLQNLDFNQLLIQNAAATYLMRIAGNAWAKQGIFHSDIVVIDRALTAKPNDMVAWIMHDEFALSRRHEMPTEATVWGVATTVIHQFRRKKLPGEEQ